MSTAGRADRHGSARAPWRRELSIWLAVLVFYLVLTSLDWPARHQAAVANSRWLFGLERSLNIDIEAALNSWLISRGPLRTAANYEYAITYLVSSFGLLVWLYLRRPATYRWARTSFILLNVVSLICFAVYPVAPPRLVADLGFTDTIVLDGTWGSWGSPWASHLNQLAAMPSLHIGWALWVSVILATIASGWRSQTASALHVLVTLLVIMATANHYLVDAFGGAIVAVACVAVTRPRADGSAYWDVAAGLLRRRVPSAQHIGGVVLLNPDDPQEPGWEGEFRRAVERRARRQVDASPRLRQHRCSPSRWRRPRWIDRPDADRSGRVSPLPRDRPLWRLLVVPGSGAHRRAVVLARHRAADGVIATELASTRSTPRWRSRPQHAPAPPRLRAPGSERP